MAQRKRRGGRAAANKSKYSSNLRSLPKKHYKEDKDTQSEKSEDHDYDDDDFEPLKKYGMRANKKEKISKENIENKLIPTKAGPQEGNKVNEFLLNISKPKLSDSESSDEEIYFKEVELKPDENREISKLKPSAGFYPEKGATESIDISTGAAKIGEDNGICKTKEVRRKINLHNAEEDNMKVDGDFVVDDIIKSKDMGSEQCNDEKAVKGNLKGSKKALNYDLAFEKNEKNLKSNGKCQADREKKVKKKAEPQGQGKTRRRSTQQREKHAKLEDETVDQDRKSRKGSKQQAKAGTKRKEGKQVEQNKNKKVTLQSLPGPSKMTIGSDRSSSDESENEWEDVNEAAGSKSLHESPRKKAKLDSDVKDISINLNVKSIHKSKGKNRKEKFLEFVQKRIRKLQNEQQISLHKCHLICLVARLQWLSNICNHPTVKYGNPYVNEVAVLFSMLQNDSTVSFVNKVLQYQETFHIAVCISIVPIGFSKVSNYKWDLLHLKRFMNWFKTGIPEDFADTCGKISKNCKEITRLQIFVAALRAIGMRTRLVISLQPVTWKVENSELFKLKKEGKKIASEEKIRSKSPVKHFDEVVGVEDKKKSNNKSSKSPKHRKKLNKDKVVSPYFEQKSGSEIKKELEEEEGVLKEKEGNESTKEKLRPGSKSLKRKVNSKDKAKNSKVKKDMKLTDKVDTQENSVRRSRKPVNYKESGTENTEDDVSSDEESHAHDGYGNVGNEDENEDSDDDDFMEAPKRSLSSKLSQRIKKDSDKKVRKSCMPSVERGYAMKLVKTIDDDVKFEKTSKPVKRRRSLNDKRNSPTVQVISSDSESSYSKEIAGAENEPNNYIDSWCEVYLKDVKKWICIDIVNGTLDDVKKCEELATPPLQYVLGIDNQNAIKDVTCRYASKFMSKTRKLRIDREWWAQTLHPYETRQKKLDAEEDTQLKMDLMQQPFPSTMSEFKNHPLYVLEGDLLKFEALYPEQPAVLGYFRNKAIYSRECIHILHTRENWLKEARVVKQGESAYKIVRGRPKKSTPLHERDKVKIDLFGLWQTEVYKPPPVVNGKVPRNEYGNVELFQPSMLPPGGVHIPIQGIHKTARKLGIDAAPAMMGWDFHGGSAHPIIEGVIVAAEFEEKLLDAWQKDEDEREKKLKEKNEKKILDRWKMLVKGLLVRERIRRKYDYRECEEFGHITAPKEETASHVSVSWPLNKLEYETSDNHRRVKLNFQPDTFYLSSDKGKSSVNDTGHCHIFPESSYRQDKISGEWTKSCSCGLTMPFEKL